jgi:hypothetical protein
MLLLAAVCALQHGPLQFAHAKKLSKMKKRGSGSGGAGWRQG